MAFITFHGLYGTKKPIKSLLIIFSRVKNHNLFYKHNCKNEESQVNPGFYYLCSAIFGICSFIPICKDWLFQNVHHIFNKTQKPALHLQCSAMVFIIDIIIQTSLERPLKIKPVTKVTGFWVVRDDRFEPPTLCL